MKEVLIFENSPVFTTSTGTKLSFSGYVGTEKWYFVTKIVLSYWEKKMFKWLRKTFEIVLRSLEQFIQTV